MNDRARTLVVLDGLRGVFGFGVAGNFAGHLEQAGEAIDFANVTAAANLPKGIFPWYVPGADGQLGAFPLDDRLLVVPHASPDATEPRVQIEPEVGVLCDVVRDGSGAIASLAPRWIAAFDDCSLRRPGARKISEKKNWGPGSKGLAATAFEVADLDPDATLEHMRIACFLERDGQAHPYGVDSAVSSYTLIGAPLLEWLVDRLREQRGSDDTPLEDVGALLGWSGARTVLVGIGASRYESLGETTFVEPGDESIVVVYDSSAHSPDEVHERVATRRDAVLTAASVLRRTAERSG